MKVHLLISPWPWSRRSSGGLRVEKRKWGWYGKLHIDGHRPLRVPCDEGFCSREAAIADAEQVAKAMNVPFSIKGNA